MIQNWKTTTAAALSATASFVLFSHVLEVIAWPAWVLALAMFAQVGGLAAFGITAKDFNVTGGAK
jgi:hypothetical protein